MKTKFACTALTLLLAPSLLTGTALAADDPNALLNPDGTKSHIVYPKSEQDQAKLNEKLQLAQEYADLKEGKKSLTDFQKHQDAFEIKYNVKKKVNVASSKSAQPSLTSDPVQPGLVSGYGAKYFERYITTLYQQPQQTYYWCGPATVSSMVNGNGGNVSQQGAASYMGTTVNGTDWYNGSGYPVKNALNYFLNTSFYESYGTSINAGVYKTNLAYDIDHGYPLAGDAYEVVGGPHLVGHPNANLFHWFAIDGYSNYGATTHYADSISGATSISYQGNIPKYSYLNSDTIAVILDGRGVIL